MFRENCILFDAMGVIYKTGEDIGDCFIPFVRGKGVTMPGEEIFELYYRASRGSFTAAEFWEKLGLGDRYPSVEREYLDSKTDFDESFLPAARELRKNYRLGYVSNDLTDWAQYLLRKHELGWLFDAVVISQEAGFRKPEAGIYFEAAKRLETGSGNCLFVDDRPANIEAARRVGMRTLLFDRGGGAEAGEADGVAGSFEEIASAAERIFGE